MGSFKFVSAVRTSSTGIRTGASLRCRSTKDGISRRPCCATLRLDDRLVRRAKRYSDRTGKSVSQIVADFFSLIDAEEEITGTEISPRVRSLIGGFKGATTTEEDYRRHLEKKYR